ncbi:MAG: PIN-like domain-containing protein [Nocardioides sp.]
MSLDLRSGFEGAVPQTQADIEYALKEGLLSLDANVLLSFYRYTPDARAALIAVLEAVDERIWVSHQAAREFWRNRVATIDNRSRASEDFHAAVRKASDGLTTAARTWAKQTAIPRDQADDVIADLRKSLEQLRTRIDDQTDDASAVSHDADKDIVCAELERVLSGRVGPPLGTAKHAETVTEGNRRAQNEVPPGYRDAAKAASSTHNEGAAGDYLVWMQSLEKTREVERPLVIVTGDEKEDWWWRHQGRFMGPRQELYRECLAETRQRLFMLRPSDLIDNADVLAVTVDEEIKTEVRRAADSEAWSQSAVVELLSRLDAEGAIQAEVIRHAAANGGIIDRATVYSVGGFEPDRLLRGFTRPSARITRELQNEGLLSDSVEPMLTPVYNSGSTAEEFEIPLEVVEILASTDTNSER